MRGMVSKGLGNTRAHGSHSWLVACNSDNGPLLPMFGFCFCFKIQQSSVRTIHSLEYVARKTWALIVVGQVALDQSFRVRDV